MDITIRTAAVAMVTLIAAVAVINVLTGRADAFTTFNNKQQTNANNTLNNAQCEATVRRHASACACDRDATGEGGGDRDGRDSTDSSYSIYQGASDECKASIPKCVAICD